MILRDEYRKARGDVGSISGTPIAFRATELGTWSTQILTLPHRDMCIAEL